MNENINNQKTRQQHSDHSLITALDEIQRADTFYTVQYSIVSKNDVYSACATAAITITLMGYGTKMFDISSVDVATYANTWWSYAEHQVFQQKKVDPPLINGCKAVTDINHAIHLSAPEYINNNKYAIRLDTVCWTYAKDAHRGAVCTERICWDATFGTSRGRHPFIRAVAADAEGNTVTLGNALVLSQDQVTFRAFWRTHMTMSFGRSLRAHAVSQSDRDPNLILVAQEAASLNKNNVVTNCTFHALDYHYRKLYHRCHGRFDGGIGTTLLEMLRTYLQTTETVEEAKIQEAIIRKWVQSESPEVPKRLKRNPLEAATLTTLTGRNRRVKMTAEQQRQQAKRTKRNSSSREQAGSTHSKTNKNDIEDEEVQYVNSIQCNNGQIMIKVRWDNDCTKDTWELDDHMINGIGTNRHNDLCSKYVESGHAINRYDKPEQITTQIGARIGNDGSEHYRDLYSVQSLHTRFERNNIIIYRCRWADYGHTSDTFETECSLRKSLGDDTVNELISERISALDAFPDRDKKLPNPNHFSDAVGDVRLGYTPHRRYLLTVFLDDILKIQHMLSLWSRKNFMHLYEWTTNRVEGDFRWVKYGDNGEKVLSKKTGITKFVQTITLECNRRYTNWVEKSSRHAISVSTNWSQLLLKYETSIVNDITRYSFKLLEQQMNARQYYSCVRCVCSDPNTTAWTIKLTKSPTASDLALNSYWRKRRVTLNIITDQHGRIHNELSCTCPYWDAVGIPCRHTLKVLQSLSCKIQFTDLDLRWWNETYRGNISKIRDAFWGESGRFSHNWVKPIGPCLEMPLTDTNINCDLQCKHDTRTIVHRRGKNPIIETPIITTNPDQDCTLDDIDLNDTRITNGYTTTKKNDYRGPSDNKKSFHTRIQERCQRLQEINTSNPSSGPSILEKLDLVIHDLELNRSQKEQTQFVPQDLPGTLDLQIEGQRSHLSVDKRHHGANDSFTSVKRRQLKRKAVSFTPGGHQTHDKQRRTTNSGSSTKRQLSLLP